MATELYGKTTESRNLTEQIVTAAGVSVGNITGTLDDSRAGTFSVRLNIFNEPTFQDGKDSALPIVQDFVNNIINQAFAQEYVEDTTVTSETAPVAEAEETATTKASSKKSK